MKLRVTPAEGDAFDYELERDSIVIGRSSTADMTLSDPFLSRHHARLTQVDGRISVEDLGSRNGTFVNDVRIEGPTLLRRGDVIRLSASSLQFADRTTIANVTTRPDSLGATIFRSASQMLEEDLSSSTDLMDSAEALRHYAQRLEILRDVHEALAGQIDEDELLALILDRIFDHLKPQQGVIYLRGADGEYYQAATRALPGQSQDIPLSRALVSEVLDKGMAALVFDASTDDRFSGSESIMLSGIRSMVAAPMLDADAGAMGMIVLNSKVAVRQFSEEDMELLTSLASVAALKHRNILLNEEVAQRRQLERELQLARSIQMSVLPEELPTFQGYRILGNNIPSRGVSGDYYVVVPRKENRECVLFIADVSGKGFSAAFVTASLEALAAAPIEGGEEPDEICEKCCRRLFQRTTDSKFATAFVAVLEPATGNLRYTNAGHNSGLLAHADGSIEELAACGLPIAMMPNSTYTRRETELEPGATLLLYTDGITEAENEQEEEYGLERLRACLGRVREQSIEAIADALEDDVATFVGGVPFADDRTVLLVQRAAG